MIHDILVCLMCPDVNAGALSTILESDVSKQFLHPCEKATLDSLIKFCKMHRYVKQFIKEYGTYSFDKDNGNQENIDGLQKGLYLQALAESLDTVLEPYRKKIVDLEARYLNKPDYSLMFLYHAVTEFDIFFVYLKSFIHELKTQKYHGCAIIQYLQRHDFHADPRVMAAMKIVRKDVSAVFLRQLSQWLIYGELVDIYGEFFIHHIEGSGESGVPSGSHIDRSSNSRVTSVSDLTSIKSDLWHYEIRYDMLPVHFAPSWAEKVLFIGQTVVMLNSDPIKKSKKVDIWNDDQPERKIGSLWNKQEHVYFNKLQVLYNNDILNISLYDRIVNEIKGFVTERLSEIAFKQADLIKHLKLVKEFYLLGRGELFLEFIKQSETIQETNLNQKVAKDVNRAFQTAANLTNNDLDRISMHVPLDDFDDSFIEEPQAFLQVVELKFDVKWPLHLFFSPLILQRYNQLFRFLLQIRNLQNDLHLVWALHREKKIGKSNQLAILRHKLMFFVDNLQYYLQADVLEGQFSILMNAVQNSKDFEYIQRAHSIFQANIMSLCFLLNAGTCESTPAAMALNRTSVPPGETGEEQENPVLTILRKIMGSLNNYCELNFTCEDPMSKEDEQKLELNDKMFMDHVSELMKLLGGLKAGPSSAPLAQFLLRLDYNYWFSSKCN